MGQKLNPDELPGARLLRIYRYLMASKERHFQSELAEKFQCSPQTIIRMMDEIGQVLGASLESGYENKRKWYRIRPRGLDSSKPEFEEVRFLSLCRDMAEDVLPGPVLARLDDTTRSLETHLQDCYPAGAASPAPLYFLGKGRIDYDLHERAISRLLEAIRHRKICEIAYRHGDGCSESLRFAPACLLYIDESLYVAGLILDGAGDFSNLAVHRIIEIQLLAENFDVAFPDYSENMFGLPWHEPRTFRILFEAGETASFILERKWSDRQKVRRWPDGSVELEITTRSEEELRAWIRSFGTEARILEGPIVEEA